MSALFISILLYLIACFSPALKVHNYSSGSCIGYRSLPGYALLGQGLLLGWIRFNFAAFANLPLWLSWIFYWRRKFPAARVSALVALVWSLETFQLLFQPYLYDEGAVVKGYLAAPHIGYYCWIASMAIIFFKNEPKPGFVS